MTGDQSVMDDSVELLDIMEGSQELHPRVHLQDVLMDILQRTDKIYETVYSEDYLKFSGEFTFQNEASSNIRVTLNVPV